ncbi:hypothetical protein [Ensifer sp. BR816]|uniref:hypothetical protein n=1 Tax=Rhizobium sp. (strain BR816) TaxID=1057002 RepID=UPI0003817407|nr:hypothetical protein [Ensifer sp. BR816]
MVDFNDLSEPEVDMDTLIEFTPAPTGWLTDNSGIVLVLLATLPLTLFLRADRVLRYSAIAVFIGAILLILLGVDGLAGAIVVIVANTSLVSAAALSMRKRMMQMEVHIEAAKSAVRDLEIAEERRQTFSARNPIERTTSSAAAAASRLRDKHQSKTPLT